MADKTTHIGNNNSDYTIDKSNRIYVLDKGDVISSGSILTDPARDIDDITVKVNGTISGDNIGLSVGTATSSGNAIVIGGDSVLDVLHEAVVAVGNGSDITNRGTIFVWEDVTSIGIQSTGNNADIVNDGFLKANVGFEIHGGTGNSVANSGLLMGYPGTVGVIFDTATGDKNRFENTGRMSVSSAVQGGDGEETVINRGTMDGSIDLAAGDDTVRVERYVGGDVLMGDGDDRAIVTGKGDLVSLSMEDGDDILDLRLDKGLSLSTTITGGMDDDLYIVSSSHYLLQEFGGGGTDTVESSATFTLAAEFENLMLTGTKSIDGTGNGKANVLKGNDASNLLSGMIGADTLEGGKGDDILTGGANIDTFVFHYHAGKDTVTDYIDGTDKINLHAYSHGIEQFSDLDGRIDQKGADVVITLEGGDKIRLENTDSNNLETTDFLF